MCRCRSFRWWCWHCSKQSIPRTAHLHLCIKCLPRVGIGDGPAEVFGMCPILKKKFESSGVMAPITDKNCGHTFSKGGIEQLSVG